MSEMLLWHAMQRSEATIQPLQLTNVHACRSLLGDKKAQIRDGLGEARSPSPRVTFDGLSRKSAGSFKQLTPAEEYQSTIGSLPPGFEEWLTFAKDNQCHLGPYRRIDLDLDVSFAVLQQALSPELQAPAP